MQNNLKAHGEFPNRHVFKAFSKIEHAEAFVEEGRFRMGSLKNYRKIEDGERRDGAEGHGHIRVLEQAHFDANDTGYFDVTGCSVHRGIHTELGNPIYIFSTSLPEVNLNSLKSKFGQFIVRIDAPKQLAHDMTEHLKLRPEKYAGGIEGRFVSYNRGEIIDMEPDNFQRTSLSYSQKPTKFIGECEFRFVAINMDSLSERKTYEYFEINLGESISYAKVI